MVKKCPKCGTQSKKKLKISGKIISCSCGYVNNPNYHLSSLPNNSEEKTGRQKLANWHNSTKKLKEIDKQIINLLKEYPEGLRHRNIAKTLNLKDRTAYNHLQKLKKLKLVKNLYPIWKNWQTSDLPEKLAYLSESDKSSQGHHICWVLPLINKPNWWNKRKDRLAKLRDWQFKKEVTANNNTYHQIENDSIQIQTYKNSIYFICKKFYTNSDLDTYLKSKDDVLEAIRYLEEQFRFKFISEGNFHLTCLSPHYVTLREALSEHFKKDKDRFIMNTKEGYELRVDFSEPFGIESDNLEVKRRYLRVVKDYQDNPNLELPSQLKENIETLRKETTELSEVIMDKSLVSKQINERIDELQNNIIKLTKISENINKRLGDAGI